MLRIVTENVDGQKVFHTFGFYICIWKLQSFSLDIYDSKDVKFLYSGIYTRHKFEEIRQAQHLKYNFDKATDKIISTVKETKSNPNVFISFSMEGKVGWYVMFLIILLQFLVYLMFYYFNITIFIFLLLLNFFRFELKRRDDHTDYAVFKLELERIIDARLNDHLICFIEQYKVNFNTNMHIEINCNLSKLSQFLY